MKVGCCAPIVVCKKEHANRNRSLSFLFRNFVTTVNQKQNEAKAVVTFRVGNRHR